MIHELRAEVFTIGRSPSSDIVLDDPLVSRRHAELRLLPDGRRQLVDVGSFNGTFVNGRRIDELVLSRLDMVGIGGSEFRFTGETLEEIKTREEVGLAAVGITVTSRANFIAVALQVIILVGSLLLGVIALHAGKGIDFFTQQIQR